MNVRRKIAAVAAGSVLLLGAAACSDDAQNDAKDKANQATSAAGDAAGSATSAAGSAAESAKSESNDDNAKDGDKDDAKDGDRDDVSKDEKADDKDADDKDGSDTAKDLPAEIKTAWENEGGKAGAFGMLKDVDEENGNVLATFEKGWITFNKETGAVPLKGKIGETWAKEGGLENKLGLPTAPEKGNAANGWTQSFQNGVLKWAKDASGKFTATTMDR